MQLESVVEVDHSFEPPCSPVTDLRIPANIYYTNYMVSLCTLHTDLSDMMADVMTIGISYIVVFFMI